MVTWAQGKQDCFSFRTRNISQFSHVDRFDSDRVHQAARPPFVDKIDRMTVTAEKSAFWGIMDTASTRMKIWRKMRYSIAPRPVSGTTSGSHKLEVRLLSPPPSHVQQKDLTSYMRVRVPLSAPNQRRSPNGRALARKASNCKPRFITRTRDSRGRTGARLPRYPSKVEYTIKIRTSSRKRDTKRFSQALGFDSRLPLQALTTHVSTCPVREDDP